MENNMKKKLTKEEFDNLGKLPIENLNLDEAYEQYISREEYFFIKKRIINAYKKRKVIRSKDREKFLQLCKQYIFPSLDIFRH